MSSVRLDSFLRPSGVAARWESGASDVRSLLDELEAKYPSLKNKLRDETGEVRRSIRVFVNGEDIRNGSGNATPLGEADRVEILHSIQGG